MDEPPEPADEGGGIMLNSVTTLLTRIHGHEILKKTPLEIQQQMDLIKKENSKQKNKKKGLRDRNSII